jgi:hypothetical protein
VLLRVMRDLCRRVPAWDALTQWPLELLVQKAVVSCDPVEPCPGWGLRRIMEIVSSGIFLPGSHTHVKLISIP